MITQIINTKTVQHLFHNWEETLIWSCIQQVMGRIYADSLKNPRSAMAILGDFAFFAGTPNQELLLFKPDWCVQDFIIMVPQNEEWAGLIEQCYPSKAKKVSRYAIKKEPDVFDTRHLHQIVSTLPKDCSIRQIDETLYHRCKALDWCKDWVAQYYDHAMWERLGLGFVILKNDEIISGASSYSSYQGGIEIEIDTHSRYRRKGLASVCGAKLILACLERNLYPSWDAQNKWSVALAEKLGYHYSHEYTAYEITGY